MSRKSEYEKVAALGCIMCYRISGIVGTPCHVHHIRSCGGRREIAPVIGLCERHHTGSEGVHGMGKKAFERFHGVSEQDLLELTEVLLNGS